MKFTLLAVAVAAVAVAAPQVAKKAYHGAQKVVTKATAPAVIPGATPIDPSIVPPTVIGMNMGLLSYWSKEEPFYNPVMAHGRIALGDNDHNEDLTNQLKTVDGALIDVPKGTMLLFTAGSAAIAADQPMICETPPGWSMTALPANVSQSGNRFTVKVAPDFRNEGLSMTLKATADHAKLDKFDCRPQGAPPGALFRADFLKDVKPFRIIRFMNWMLANSMPPGKWSERPLPNQLSAIPKGLAVETMVALANLNHSDPWFTLPFDADDDYQRHFATYVRDHLDPGLKAYVELSNEVWNSGFPQSKKASELGKARYPSADAAQQNDWYYGDRVRDMMAIWTEVFAGQKPRLVRVLASQAGWSQRAENALGHAETWKAVDALAIAPYFGDVPFDIKGNGKPRVDGILAKMPVYIDQAIVMSRSNKLVASKYGLRMIAYEGGPGMNAFEHDMVADIGTAYHDPRFIALYTSFLERWRSEIGGEFVLYDYSGDGIWSHLDHTGQSLSEAPKMKAAVDFIATLPAASR